ncbi:hypothetical protein HYW75_07075 [Candidatus Pacearchaeota archaeon]|nr:hypothetical protein [Candidatus Pacearchaeota archaeon]
MNEIGILTKIGLSENEARAYLLLLEEGSVKAGVLIRKLGMYSKTAYETLNKLIRKGLVAHYFMEKRKYFSAVEPEKLVSLVDDEQNKLAEMRKNIISVIPNLKERMKSSKEYQEVFLFLDNRGMKSVFEDALVDTDEILVFGGGGKFKETLGTYSELWHKKRIKKKINLKLLWNENMRHKKRDVEKFKYISVKFLPKEFDNPAPAIIYNDKVALTVWTGQPCAMLIKSKEVYKSFRQYFALLWKIAKI